MNNKEYKGWEVAKMISEGILENEDRLKDEEQQIYLIKDGTLIKEYTCKGEPQEVPAIYLTDKTTKYMILAANRDLKISSNTKQVENIINYLQNMKEKLTTEEIAILTKTVLKICNK